MYLCVVSCGPLHDRFIARSNDRRLSNFANVEFSNASILVHPSFPSFARARTGGPFASNFHSQKTRVSEVAGETTVIRYFEADKCTISMF